MWERWREEEGRQWGGSGEKRVEMVRRKRWEDGRRRGWEAVRTG
jgi:hypothetical protein